MPKFFENDEDRRRVPRFNCSGQAKIRRLPWDGTVVAGQLRNLSLGGICVETAHRIEHGERTEMLVCVNAVSFRAVGLVKAMQEGSRASMEFIQMSAGGQGMLRDLVDQLTRFHAVISKLRSGRAGTKGQLFRELEDAGVCTALFKDRVTALGRAFANEGSDRSTCVPVGAEGLVETEPLLVKVDLFG